MVYIKGQRKKYLKKYYEENKDKIKLKGKKHYEKNRNKILEHNKKYRLQNLEKENIRAAKYYEKNKEKRKKYREQNKEKKKEWDKKNYSQNMGRERTRSTKYYNKNKKGTCVVCGNIAHEKYCSKKCMGEGMSRENHPKWKGGISNDPYPKEWNNIRKQIRNRDNNRCRRCGRAREEFKHALSVHHIDADKSNINFNNLITLCDRVRGSCHGLTKGKEHLFAKGFRNILKRLYKYKYK